MKNTIYLETPKKSRAKDSEMEGQDKEMKDDKGKLRKDKHTKQDTIGLISEFVKCNLQNVSSK